MLAQAGARENEPMTKQTDIQQLILALQLVNNFYPHLGPATTCEHDILYLCMDAGQVTLEHINALEWLGFDIQEWVQDGFQSYRHGSC